ncbi:hypothetical protein DRQ36_04770, partial [bacterium]
MNNMNSKVWFSAALLFLFVTGATAYYIESFDSEIYLFKDGSYEVTERLVVDFGSENRHGIYREIPYKYEAESIRDRFLKRSKKVRIKILSVTDDEGNSYQTKIKKRRGYINIRIGSPSVYVSGTFVYNIKYKVEDAILYFDDYDELYWNVTGTEWDCNISSASAKVYVPADMPVDKLRTNCYTGAYGSQEQNCSAEIVGKAIHYKTNRPLGVFEGLTLGLAMPKGYIGKPSFMKRVMWELEYVWPLVFFPIGLLILIVLYLKKGRDPLYYSIAPRYEPPVGLTPAEAGTLIDEKVDMQDMTSTIVDLAVRGYLKIIEIEKKKIIFFTTKDYALVRLKSADDKLKKHEELMFDGLFDKGTIDSDDLQKVKRLCPDCVGKEAITVSSLKEKFYTELPEIKKSIYKNLVTQGYFPSDPDKVRGKYAGWGIMLIIVGAVLSLVGNPLFIISAVLIGILAILFGRFMPRKTKKGSIQASQIAGFEEFVRRVEKDRIARMAQDDPTVFERLLPYAMALGVADQWAEAFKDLFKEAPNWYVG